LRDIASRFAGVAALTILMACGPASVCLLGDNGAGKSTLIKILSGFMRKPSAQF